MAESVFSEFIVENKIEELRASLQEYEKDFSIFDEKKVAIAVPVYDESMRNIQLFDNKLYFTQLNDAKLFRDLFMEKSEVTGTVIISRHYDVPGAKNINCDFLILLHEFTGSEEDNLIRELQDNGNKDFGVYKLY